MPAAYVAEYVENVSILKKITPIALETLHFIADMWQELKIPRQR